MQLFELDKKFFHPILEQLNMRSCDLFLLPDIK